MTNMNGFTRSFLIGMPPTIEAVQKEGGDDISAMDSSCLGTMTMMARLAAISISALPVTTDFTGRNAEMSQGM